MIGYDKLVARLAVDRSTSNWLCENGVHIVDAGAEPLSSMCKKKYPKFSHSDFELLLPVWCIFCAVRQAARTFPVMTSRSRMCPISDNFGVLTFCALSASAGSRSIFRMVGDTAVFHVVHWCTRLVMVSLFVSSCCVRVVSC